jgi:hypothetical protein
LKTDPIFIPSYGNARFILMPFAREEQDATAGNE